METTNPSVEETTKQLVELTGKRSFGAVKETFDFFGGSINLAYATFLTLFTRPFYFKLVVEQIYQLGVKSLSLTTITALSTGMVMSLQFGLGLERFGGKPYVPKVVGLSILKELGPVLTCLMLAGRVGSGIAAEIGSMKVTQQIDAIRALGTDPIRKIVIPRVLALVFLAPILTLFADITGILGGMVLSSAELNIHPVYYYQQSLYSLKLTDFTYGIYKTFVFGFIIGITGCYYGLKTTGGTQGVGQATTKAVVTSSIWVTVSDFVMTKIFWMIERGVQ